MWVGRFPAQAWRHVRLFKYRSILRGDYVLCKLGLICLLTPIFSRVINAFQPRYGVYAFSIIVSIAEDQPRSFPLSGYILHLNPIVCTVTDPCSTDLLQKGIVTSDAIIVTRRKNERQCECNGCQLQDFSPVYA